MYDRKPTVFGWKDIIRIAKGMEPVGVFDFVRRIRMLRLQVVLTSKMLAIPQFFDLEDLVDEGYDDVDSFFGSIEDVVSKIRLAQEDLTVIQAKGFLGSPLPILPGSIGSAPILPIVDYHALFRVRSRRFWVMLNGISQEALNDGEV